MFFWILGDILVELGRQKGLEIALKIYEISSYFLNKILMDFGSPGAAFRVRCQRRSTRGNIVLASRATKLLSI